MAGAVPFGVSFTYNDGSDLLALMKQLQTCSCLVMDPGANNENWSIVSKLVESYDLGGDVTSEQMPYLRYLICHDDPEMKMTGVKPFTDLIVDDAIKPDLPDLQGDDLAGLFQTSGSTGTPKIIAHTHSSMLTPSRLDIRALDRNPADAKYFNDRPFSWIGGYPFTLFMGSSRVTCSDLDLEPAHKARMISDVVRQENCQLVLLPAAVLPEIAKMENVDDVWSTRTVILGGSPIAKRTLAPIETKCKLILIAYGGSETLSVSFTAVTDSSSFIDYTCGRVTPGASVKIVDRNEEIVPPNTRGEIYVKSNALFRDYYNDLVKTAAVFTDDGWYRTDDMGRLLEDGTLLVEGRKSNMIISGRMNVAPEILEAAIEKCPGVEAAVVVPVPDDVMYQVICACVKVVPGSGFDEAAVRKFCEETHSDTHQVFTVLPKYYLFLESFPETTSGKVARKTLCAMAERSFKKNVEEGC